MLFLSAAESEQWSGMARSALSAAPDPTRALAEVRPALRSHCAWHVGAVLAAHGRLDAARGWLRTGARDEPVPGNACLLGYVDHHGGLRPPGEATFDDPFPYVNFSTTPELLHARANFADYGAASFPGTTRPLRIVDLGCGDGSLTRALLETLLRRGCIPAVGEVLLVDTSERMLALARAAHAEAFPGARVEAWRDRIEGATARIGAGWDLAVSGFAWHHMPWDEKLRVARRLATAVDHVMLFEVEGNHDLPEMHAPELSVSLYQVYGGGARFLLAGARPDVAQASVERFLFAEVVSSLTEPRGRRTEYHMLRSQWLELLADGLGTGFSRRADHTCHADGQVEIFMLHHGRR